MRLELPLIAPGGPVKSCLYPHASLSCGRKIALLRSLIIIFIFQSPHNSFNSITIIPLCIIFQALSRRLTYRTRLTVDRSVSSGIATSSGVVLLHIPQPETISPCSSMQKINFVCHHSSHKFFTQFLRVAKQPKNQRTHTLN